MYRGNTDEPLERAVIRLLNERNAAKYPEPQWQMDIYNHKVAACPKCSARFFKMQGYHQHYTLRHAEDYYQRLKARKIIKLVRGYAI